MFGSARGVILPSSWLTYIGRQIGLPLKEVTLETNGKIKIKPVMEVPDG